MNTLLFVSLFFLSSLLHRKTMNTRNSRIIINAINMVQGFSLYIFCLCFWALSSTKNKTDKKSKCGKTQMRCVFLLSRPFCISSWLGLCLALPMFSFTSSCQTTNSKIFLLLLLLLLRQQMGPLYSWVKVPFVDEEEGEEEYIDTAPDSPVVWCPLDFLRMKRDSNDDTHWTAGSCSTERSYHEEKIL